MLNNIKLLLLDRMFRIKERKRGKKWEIKASKGERQMVTTGKMQIIFSA